MLDVAVIGGGITGLAAAFELTRQGAAFRLFEASPRAGGVIRTERVDGYLIDAGPDAILATKPAGLALCQELGLSHRLIPMQSPRTAFVVRRGRLHPLPEPAVLGVPTTWRGLVDSGLFSWAGKARMAADYILPRRTDTTDESIAAFVGRRFGREAVSYLADPLLAGIHMGSADRLSVRALFPRLAEAEQQHGSVLRGLGRDAAERDPAGPFRSLVDGMGELVSTLVDHLPDDTIHPDSPIDRLSGRAPFTVHAGAATLEARAVILAVPAFVACRLLGSIDAEAAALSGGLRYASSATVFVAYPRDRVQHPLQGSGFVVPGVETSFAIRAATWISSKWPGRAPAGQVFLRAFLGGSRDPDAVARTDDALSALAHRDLGRLLDISGEPIFSRVYRWRDASPQYEVGHLGRMAQLTARLEQFPGLLLAGSGFRGAGISDCIEAGRAAARAAAAGRGV